MFALKRISSFKIKASHSARTVTSLQKVLYTAKTHTSGGRDGVAKSDDGRLDIILSPPGSAGKGTNPEQLFAAGYSACFIGAMRAVAGVKKINIPANTSVDASVNLGTVPNGYGISAKLAVSLPGMEITAAKELVDAAHQRCPYSNATRGNIDVEISVTN